MNGLSAVSDQEPCGLFCFLDIHGLDRVYPVSVLLADKFHHGYLHRIKIVIIAKHGTQTVNLHYAFSPVRIRMCDVNGGVLEQRVNVRDGEGVGFRRDGFFQCLFAHHLVKRVSGDISRDSKLPVRERLVDQPGGYQHIARLARVFGVTHREHPGLLYAEDLPVYRRGEPPALRSEVARREFFRQPRRFPAVMREPAYGVGNVARPLCRQLPPLLDQTAVLNLRRDIVRVSGHRLLLQKRDERLSRSRVLRRGPKPETLQQRVNLLQPAVLYGRLGFGRQTRYVPDINVILPHLFGDRARGYAKRRIQLLPALCLVCRVPFARLDGLPVLDPRLLGRRLVSLQPLQVFDVQRVEPQHIALGRVEHGLSLPFRLFRDVLGGRLGFRAFPLSRPAFFLPLLFLAFTLFRAFPLFLFLCRPPAFAYEPRGRPRLPVTARLRLVDGRDGGVGADQYLHEVGAVLNRYPHIRHLLGKFVEPHALFPEEPHRHAPPQFFPRIGVPIRKRLIIQAAVRHYPGDDVRPRAWILRLRPRPFVRPVNFLPFVSRVPLKSGLSPIIKGGTALVSGGGSFVFLCVVFR